MKKKCLHDWNVRFQKTLLFVVLANVFVHTVFSRVRCSVMFIIFLIAQTLIWVCEYRFVWMNLNTMTIVGIKYLVHKLDFQKMLNTKQIEPESDV